MLHFLPQDEYTLVIPGPEAVEGLKKAMAEGRKQNQVTLDSIASPLKGGALTGTFIYSHPPDYIGRPTIHYGKKEWAELFRELKEMGIDTVIYQAAVWYEVRESSYPSHLFKDFKTWDSLEPLCAAAAEEGMTFFLGGLGNLMAFDESASDADFARDRDMQLACFKELMAYRGGFHGFYMSPETGYPAKRNPAREKRLNTYYRQVCQGVKDLLPGLPILASPATLYYENQERDMEEFLLALFQDVPIDIMCPQDSIGTFGSRLKYLKPSFEIWQRVCKAAGMSLWVNVESFERCQVNTPSDFRPADFARLRVQLANAAQFGEKIVSWEVPYFYSSLAGERGVRLRQDYLASFAAGER